jgi:peptidoglycan/LPS O-acetylase OafA/YrhL
VRPAVPERPANSERLHFLDGIRGLAALVVVFHHFHTLAPGVGAWMPLSELKSGGWAEWTLFAFKFPPLAMFVAGPSAVMVFFVLSGFVLHRMIAGMKDYTFFGYLIRRAIRLYGPYIAAFALALCADAFLPPQLSTAGLNELYTKVWAHPIQLHDIIGHVMFLGTYNSNVFDPVVWSLVHELRISIIYPLLLIAFAPRSTGTQLLGLAVLFGIGDFLHIQYRLNNAVDWGDSVYYSSFFVAGLMVSINSRKIPPLYARLSRAARVFLWITSLMLVTFGPRSGRNLNNHPLGDLIAAAGACWIIIAAIGSDKAQNFLSLRPIAWLGKVSYSLYLVHVIVLFTILHALRARQLSIGLFCVYLPAALIAAGLFYHSVERPAVALSRRLGRSFRKIRLAVTTAAALEADSRPKLTEPAAGQDR